MTPDKIKACFLLGACGDALGAPIEELKKLADIRQKYGVTGLDYMTPHKNAFGTGVNYPAGRITDDTTMAMTVAAALTLARGAAQPGQPAFDDALREYLWQGFLNWGRFQDKSLQGLKPDTKIAWPQAVKAFWRDCGGAGANTIASLQQLHPGTVEAPQQYDCVIRGKRVTGPNRGCGGMMRVAPIGLLDIAPEKIFETACMSAAITNGHPEAYAGAGAIALYVRFAATGMPMENVLTETEKILSAFAGQQKYKDGAAACLKLIRAGRAAALKRPNSLDVIDALPRALGFSNPFLAGAVLTQVTYVLASQQNDPGVRRALVLAANHGGDSDSVAAIAGNVLGVKHGTTCLPRDWVDALIQKRDIETMAQAFHTALTPTAFRRPPSSRPKI